MDFGKIKQQMRSIVDYPQLDIGDYTIRILETFTDSVHDFDRQIFRFEVDGVGEAIPNKIYFLFPHDANDTKAIRTVAFRWRHFCACFGFNYAHDDPDPRDFVGRLGRVRIDSDNWGYLQVRHFYTDDGTHSNNPSTLARLADMSAAVSR